jgi:hypothetical protein
MPRQFTEEQKARKREYLKAWRKANPDLKKAAQDRAYAKARVDPVAKAKNSANVLRWQREQREKANAKNALRREREAEAGGARLAAADAATQTEVFAGACAYCLAPAEEWDHVVPLVDGGLTNLENCVPACRVCNARKGSKSLLSWLVKKCD